MGKIDGGLRSIFRDRLPTYHWQSIESALTGGGIPDSNYCVNGLEGWVEFKQTAANKIGSLDSDQVGWHMRRSRAGGRTFIAVRYWHSGGPRKGEAVDALYLFPGAAVKSLFISGLICGEEVGRWPGGPGGWRWGEVSRLLAPGTSPRSPRS